MSEQDKNESRQQSTMDNSSLGSAPGVPETHDGETEFYVEPMRVGGREMAGIILALAALALIGISGYIWINPDLSFQSVFHRQPAASAGMTQAAAPMPAGGQAAAAGMPETPAAGAAGRMGASMGAGDSGTPAADTSCATCGMDALQSMSHVIATWSDGHVTHHDSWDCLFNFEKEYQKKLVSAQVRNYLSPESAPEMLDAAKAYYLFDTKETIKGSMPPYVAAFPTRAEADANRAGLGGEVVDFSQLKTKMLQGLK